MNWSCRRNEGHPNLKALYHSSKPPVSENVFSMFLRLQWIFHMPMKAACYESFRTKVTYKVTSKVQLFSQVCLSFKAEPRNNFKGSPWEPFPHETWAPAVLMLTCLMALIQLSWTHTIVRLFPLCPLMLCGCFLSLHGSKEPGKSMARKALLPVCCCHPKCPACRWPEALLSLNWGLWQDSQPSCTSRSGKEGRWTWAQRALAQSSGT